MHGQNCVVSLTGKKLVLSACIFECGPLPTTYTPPPHFHSHMNTPRPVFLLCIFVNINQRPKKNGEGLGTKLPIVHVHLHCLSLCTHTICTRASGTEVFRAATLCTAFFSPMSSMQLYADIKNSMQPSPAHLLHTLNLRI